MAGTSRRRSTRATVRGADLRREILNRATSVYHGVGTCRMGVDEARGGRSRPQGPGHRGAAGRRRLDHAVDHRRQHQCPVDHDRRAGRGAGARHEAPHPSRPRSRTRLLAGPRRPGPSSSGGDLEADQGLHRRGPRRAAAVHARGHRARVRPGPGGPAGVVAVAAGQAAEGVQEGAHAAGRQRPDDRRPDPGRERQEPADGDRGDLRPADGDQPLPQAGAEAAAPKKRAGRSRSSRPRRRSGSPRASSASSRPGTSPSRPASPTRSRR